VLYSVYLSEKIGYWRYILIKRHLDGHPSNRFAPLFDFFEPWCQDENRHGDIFNVLLQCWPKMTEGLRGQLLSRFFLWSVFLTHSLTVAERSDFYELLGMDARRFDDAVIEATNRTARRAFPVVFQLSDQRFLAHRDGLVHCFQQLQSLANQGWSLQRSFQSLGLKLRFAGHALGQLFNPMEASR
jgi:magnesium-protoporphyrin IX monomethyl ester (oxidative) cyclase